MSTINRIAAILAPAALVLTTFATHAAAKPLKVYILAGQSNMQGHAKVETFDYIGDDPATAPMLKEMHDADGKPIICEKVWISYYTADRRTGGNGEGFGKLTAGYGARDFPDVNHGRIGPEFTFGIHASKVYDGPILIIKTAWGGKSLNTDFRPPSAGPYVLPKDTQELWAKHPQGAHGIPKAEDRKKWQAEKAAKTGVYYRLMMEHVKNVLADPKRVCPAYDPKQGYELAGFVWFQAWNDMCDGHTYPNRHKPGGYAEYSRLMAHFIRDVRKELSAPKMPFVIGVIGVHGDKATGGIANLRPAMAAPAAMPEFKGNVAAVQTAKFWDEDLQAIEDKMSKVKQMRWFLRTEHKDHANKDGKMTREQQQAYVREFEAKLLTPEDRALWKRAASHQAYHYFGCAKTMAQIGKAFAEAMLKMEKGTGDTSSVKANWQSLDSRPAPQWWRDAKFGIFVHWGVYSVPAWCDGWYSEWYYRLISEGSGGSKTMREHHLKTWGKDFRYPQFAPRFKAEEYNPEAWAKLFRDSGATYVVLTSKHHDGFCLWDAPDSKGWNAVDVGPQKDLIAPLAKAVRAQGLKFGLYYSMMEWDQGDNLPGNKYPQGSDEYVSDHVLPQIKDLVRRYNPAIMWPDGEWDWPSSYWRSEEFLAWYVNNAPNKERVVWNDRWGKETRGKHGAFYTTEYGRHGKEGGAHPWEETRGIGRSFGYNSWYEDKDERYPSSRKLLDVLVDVLSRGGNLLLNVGPKADGTFIKVFVDRLRDFGRFLKANGEAVYGSRLPFKSEQGKDIKFTCGKNNTTIYAFIRNKPANTLTLNGVFARKGEEVVLLADPKKTPLAWSNQGTNLTINGIDAVSQNGEFYWVFKIPGGFHADPKKVTEPQIL
jgi:alpha-L-fucosidase